MFQLTRLAADVAIAFNALGLLAGTMCGQGMPGCGRYPTVSKTHGPVCERVGILPWFVAIPGQWETDLSLGTSGDQVRFSYFSSLSLTSLDVNLVVEDSDLGSTFYEATSELDLSAHGPHWTRVLGVCIYAAGQCPPRSATGSFIVTADASSATALDAVSASAVYKYTSSGSLVSRTTAPVIFMDQAAIRWNAIITETPRDQQSQPGATITSFAVANLSTQPQAVLIRICDERGQILASTKTPILDKALSGTEVLVGGCLRGHTFEYLGNQFGCKPMLPVPERARLKRHGRFRRREGRPNSPSCISIQRSGTDRRLREGRINLPARRCHSRELTPIIGHVHWHITPCERLPIMVNVSRNSGTVTFGNGLLALVS
jgi:hypothetical protein